MPATSKNQLKAMSAAARLAAYLRPDANQLAHSIVAKAEKITRQGPSPRKLKVLPSPKSPNLAMLDPLSISIPLAEPRPVAEAHLPVRKLLRPSPSHPDDYVMELDFSHGIDPFTRCQRQWEGINIRSREANRDSSATSFGTLFHSLEELRLRDAPNWKAQQLDLIQDYGISNPPSVGDHRTSDRMVDVITKYNAIYENDGWPQKVFSDVEGPFIERPFKVELTTMEVNSLLCYPRPLLVGGEVRTLRDEDVFPVRNLHILYTGRIDLILQDSDLLWVPDHKTTSRGGKEFADAFRLSLQTRGYCWAAQKIIGREVIGGIVNGVIIRPLTKTGNGTEFTRNNYFYTQDSLSEWEEDVKDICSDIVASLVRGRFPQYARSYISPCAKCDFQENCSLPRSQRAADLASNLYRDVVWNPMHD